MTDLGKQVWDLGTSLTRAHAEMALSGRSGPIRLVYLLWHGDELIGICGTKERAEQEADSIGRALRTEIRIEAREVHS